ncbi:hypothetical protein FRX31_002794 [Thalictrum thalictroides]|uniref:Uncharacterized protein n=1 Tax=Thalictrum thalictroides TaxID=46969 RepID=A0A7J6XFA3_THATH|nr:hypothetical protein FRX31_002794 [Thalictrum thalictroides]
MLCVFWGVKVEVWLCEKSSIQFLLAHFDPSKKKKKVVLQDSADDSVEGLVEKTERLTGKALQQLGTKCNKRVATDISKKSAKKQKIDEKIALTKKKRKESSSSEKSSSDDALSPSPARINLIRIAICGFSLYN